MQRIELEKLVILVISGSYNHLDPYPKSNTKELEKEKLVVQKKDINVILAERKLKVLVWDLPIDAF